MDPQAAKQQFVERVKNATNILVTVSKDPTVDQLASALGLTLMLNKIGKHGTAVVSGAIPPAMQFLEPNKTFDESIDSLRDFVISLSTEKADKLRYKKEDGVVKIFITPYKTKLTKDDFEFTQGDFNVDVVIALGVQDREHLDESIRAHGRILHDATVVTINCDNPSSLGSTDWTVPEASSLSEMLVSVSEAFQGGILDEQMSTAFLTGIVAATDRFRNDKTSPKVMTMAAQLMAAGANQQLVATNLDKSQKSGPAPVIESAPEKNTSLPPVASDEQVANDINAILNDSEQSFKSKKEPEADQKPELAPIEMGLPEIDNLVSPKSPKEATTSEPEANSEEGVDESLGDLQKELESLANTVEVKDETPQIKSSDRLSIDLPTNDSLDLNTDASDALPIMEDQENTTLPVNVDLPTNNEVMQDLNPSAPQRPFNTGLVAPSETPSGPQIQTSSIISDSKGLGSRAALGPEPSLGGTFNATSQDAADEKRRQNELSTNKAILSHKAPPTEQANMTNQPVQFGSNQPPQISTSQQPVVSPSIDLDAARRAVEEATMAADPTVGNNPIQALNAQELPSEAPVSFGPSSDVPPMQDMNPPQMQQQQYSQPPQMPPAQPQQQFSAPPQQNAMQPQNVQQNSFALPQQPQAGPGPLAPPPPPPGGSAPIIAPKVSPANLGSFAPAPTPQPQQQQMPQQQMPPMPQQQQQQMQPPQFGMPPSPGSVAPPPAPIQFDATPPPQGPRY